MTATEQHHQLHHDLPDEPIERRTRRLLSCNLLDDTAIHDHTQEPQPYYPSSLVVDHLEAHTNHPTGHPAIWVSTLSEDESDDHQDAGHWICAAHPRQEVANAVSDAARRLNGPAGLYVRDVRGFGPWTPTALTTLDTVCTVARGIAEHGPAYAAWAQSLGTPSMFDDFTDHYVGDYDNCEQWANEAVDLQGATLDDTNILAIPTGDGRFHLFVVSGARR